MKTAMILEARIDGGLLFSAIVNNPVERLHLKRYVKNYVEQQEALVSDRNQVQDDKVISVKL